MIDPSSPEAGPGLVKAPRSLPVLSVTRKIRYGSCPRMDYFHSIVRRVLRKKDENLRFGSLFHKGLEAWWRARMDVPTDPDGWILSAIDAVRSDTDSDPFDRIKAEILMHGYHTVWSGDDIEVLGVEVPFEGDLRNPLTSGVSRTFRLGGKIDAIVRAPSGQVWLVEHKTSSEDISDGSIYWQRLTLDSQVSTYMTGARMLGYEPAGCIYDVIGKPSMRPLKATPIESRKYTKPTAKNPVSRLYAGQREFDETPEEYGERLVKHLAGEPEEDAEEGAEPKNKNQPRYDQYFRRAPIVRLQDEQREAEYNMWGVALQIRESMATGIWPRNEKSCEQYRRLCDYFPVCTKQTGIDDDSKYRDKEKT